MKRPLSLLEVVIALALTTILLTSLFTIYRHLIQSKTQVETARSQLHWQFLTQTRLNQAFETVQECSIFYSNGSMLFFKFDNGIDPDPQFCGTHVGEFGLDNKKLIFKINDRVEIFHTNINHFEMKFFDPKKKEWVEGWMNSILPSLIHLKIDGHEFFFNIPQAKTPAFIP